MDLVSTANHTKWEDLRRAMHDLPFATRFRCQDLSGHYSRPDGEWFYHFRDGGYETMRFVDIHTDTDEQRGALLSELKRVRLAGHPIDGGFRVYGYAEPGQVLDYF